MDTKQIGITILVAAIVSAIISWGVTAIASPEPQASPPNNTFSTPVSAARMPDLIVQSMRAVGGGCSGGTNSTNATCNALITATVKNIGNAGAGSSYTHLAVNDYCSGSGTGTYLFTPQLSPNQEYIVNTTFHGLTWGCYFTAFAQADAFNQINERNENNNFYNISFTLP